MAEVKLGLIADFPGASFVFVRWHNKISWLIYFWELFLDKYIFAKCILDKLKV